MFAKYRFLAGLLGFCLLACLPPASAEGGGKPIAPAALSVAFVDLPRFDEALATALAGSQPVQVTFYAKVSPNTMPVRLQRWLSTLEKAGGRFDVRPPAGELAPRHPAVLLGLLGGLWSSLKAYGEIREEAMFKAASGHDAVLQLARDGHDDVLIERVIFEPAVRTPQSASTAGQ